jgi:hypothetical protein
MSPNSATKARLSVLVELRRFSGWLLAVACCALAAPAWATPEDRTALQEVAETMRGNYAAGHYDQAEGALLSIDRACADRCSTLVKAQIWLYVASVRGTGRGDQDGARAAFERALGLDSALAPDPAYANKATSATYLTVRARMNLGPYAKTVAHLDPPPAKPGQPAQPAPLADDDYTHGDPVPPGYHVETGPRRRMIIGGSIVLGVGHSCAVAAAGSGDFGWKLTLPVLGPWITLATQDYKCTTNSSNSSIVFPGCGRPIFLVFDGVIQATGALLLVVGLSARTARLVPDNTAQVTISPVRLGRSGYGLGMAGVF